MVAKEGDDVNIGLRIKQRRKELKMTADELGKLIGKDRSTIYRYEKGDIETMPIEILEPVAKFLQTTPQHLMGWDTEEHKEIQKKNDILADITLKLMEDQELLEMVEILSNLNFEKRAAVKSVLFAFSTVDK